MCKGGDITSAVQLPHLNIEKVLGSWRLKLALARSPELDIGTDVLRLKLDDDTDFVTVQIPEYALPVDADATRCKFSKKRGELVVEWPCSPVVGAEEERVPEVVSAYDEAVTTAKCAGEEDDAKPQADFIHSEMPAVESQAAEICPAAKSTQQQECTNAVNLAEQAAEHVTEEAPADDIAKDSTLSITAEEWKAKGNSAVKAGDVEGALSCYTSGIAVVHGDAAAEALLRSNRALCFYKLGRHQEAVDDALKCVELSPDFVKAYLRGAMALRALNRPIEAVALLKRAPRNDEAGSLAAEIKPEAEAAEKARIEALPDVERIKEEGNLLFKKGLFESALEKYSKAIEKCAEPDSSLALSLRNNRAACHHQLSDFMAVVRDTDFVLEHEPANLKALLRRMLALEPLEKYEQALKDARAVLIQDPCNDMANKVQHRLGKLVRDLSRA